MKRFLLSTTVFAVAVVAAGVAQAADLGVRSAAPPVKAPAYIPPPLYTWTGFYLGGNVGYGWGDGSGTFSTPGVGVTRVTGNGDGILGGGQIGYNWQFGAIVFGVETDFQGSGESGHFSGVSNLGNQVNGTEKIPWFGTIRGRLGYAWNNWLFYATGGGAYTHSTISGTAGGPGGGAFGGSATSWTWTIGGGVEAFIAPRWSVKAEYLYFGDPDKIPLPPNTTLNNGTASGNLVRVGFNYHF